MPGLDKYSDDELWEQWLKGTPEEADFTLACIREYGRRRLSRKHGVEFRPGQLYQLQHHIELRYRPTVTAVRIISDEQSEQIEIPIGSYVLLLDNTIWDMLVDVF